jgi:hypothetical protein
MCWGHVPTHVRELVVFVHDYHVNLNLQEERSTSVSMLLKLLLACSSNSSAADAWTRTGPQHCLSFVLVCCCQAEQGLLLPAVYAAAFHAACRCCPCS